MSIDGTIDMSIISMHDVVSASLIAFEFDLEAPLDVDMSVDAFVGVVYGLIGGALVITAEVNDSGWTAVLTALELTLTSLAPAPPEEPLLAW